MSFLVYQQSRVDLRRKTSESGLDLISNLPKKAGSSAAIAEDAHATRTINMIMDFIFTIRKPFQVAKSELSISGRFGFYNRKIIL